MATTKKAKGKAKTKRKPPIKTTSKKKAKAARKQPAKKALVRRTSVKKGRKTHAAVEATPTAPSAQPVAAASAPGLPAQAAPVGERIGVVTHYYSQP
jgi:hypothetical protein